MDNSDNENDYFSEPDMLSEDDSLNIFLGVAFIAVWIISLFVLFNLNS